MAVGKLPCLVTTEFQARDQALTLAPPVLPAIMAGRRISLLQPKQQAQAGNDRAKLVGAQGADELAHPPGVNGP
jgi:hypothetical protein